MTDWFKILISTCITIVITITAFFGGRMIEVKDKSLLLAKGQEFSMETQKERGTWIRETNDIVKANAILIGKNAESINSNIAAIQQVRRDLHALIVQVATIEEREKTLRRYQHKGKQQ